ncbi:hypothetical protein SNEBB_009097 [Seison nebaliae]|nr:hypothetical protein SNEBB_009097 [Seison nebaliae]
MEGEKVERTFPMNSTKQLLRRDCLHKIKSINSLIQFEKSRCIIRQIEELDQYEKAENISIFFNLSNRTEVITIPFIQHLLENTTKNVFVPFVSGNCMKMKKLTNDNKKYLHFHHFLQPNEKFINHFDDLNDHMEFKRNIFIIPGVAFTADGKRLGRGGGYYDKFLSRILHRDNNTLIGVTFKEVLLDDFLTEEHDILMDLVISDKVENL